MEVRDFLTFPIQNSHNLRREFFLSTPSPRCFSIAFISLINGRFRCSEFLKAQRISITWMGLAHHRLYCTTRRRGLASAIFSLVDVAWL